MAIDPYQYVISPRLVATLIAVPLLTAVFDIAGIVAGYMTSVGVFQISDAAYLTSLNDATEWNDVYMGLVKSIVFALIIVWISTSLGFFIHLDRAGALGSEGVGRVTTNAVVLSSVSILVADYLVTSLLL